MNEINDAIESVAQRFAFPGYLEASPRSYAEIASTTLQLLPRGARVLDFGAGPCDKTAILQQLGFACVAYDDLSDPWHLIEENREKILRFAREEGIEYHVAPEEPLPQGPFQMVMAHDVLEHLHTSPRELLTQLLERTDEGGYLFVTVPNAANARKRVALIRGHTNLPTFASYYWSDGSWRGHVREYVRADLQELATFLGLEIVTLRGTHHLAHRLPLLARLPYLATTRLFDGLCDTWLMVARKPARWTATVRPDDDLARELKLRTSPYWSRES